ncbi:MAG: hypothetical protein KIT11_04815 [Fimbriimonadaceae bacterium]|nr:hypothetical protein [Fimbriimonadaceae bacterium]QYK56784.1 MAG: hypothetical protein KF733_04705 [Fimbriimonadaceae bacterium]
MTEPAKKMADFEGSLMKGCSTIGLGSFITYGLTVWPWLTFPEYKVQGLLEIALAGCLPAVVFGIIATRKFGLAGASGFFGGGMASAVFMYLRLQSTMLGRFSERLPAPEYPERWAWIVPLAWFLAVAAIAALFLPARHEGNDPPSG